MVGRSVGSTCAHTKAIWICEVRKLESHDSTEMMGNCLTVTDRSCHQPRLDTLQCTAMGKTFWSAVILVRCFLPEYLEGHSKQTEHVINSSVGQEGLLFFGGSMARI